MVSSPEELTWSALLRELRRTLQSTEGDDAAFCARELLERASGMDGAEILRDGMLPADPEAAERARADAARLAAGEPLAYILGEWDFRGLTLKVTPAALIPREDTGAVTELALEAAEAAGPGAEILDLCTGTGCIGLALADALPGARLTLGDISEEALALAAENAARLFPKRKIRCERMNALAVPFIGQHELYDVIVSNPPYITAGEMQELPDSVRAYEPGLALFGGEDGLDFYRSLAGNWSAALKPGGRMCLEFGMGQEDAVASILSAHGFRVLRQKQDEHGIIRAVTALKEK